MRSSLVLGKVSEKLGGGGGGQGGKCSEVHHNLSVQTFLYLVLLWFNFWSSNWKLSGQQLMLCLQIFMYDERKSLICIANPGGKEK